MLTQTKKNVLGYLWVSIALSVYCQENAGTVFDLLSYPANQEKKHVFTISNPSPKSWNILKVRTTCSCVEGTLEKSLLIPGGRVDLRVIVKANSLSGTFCKNIYLETDVPEQRFLKFTIKGNAIPAVVVQPEKLLYIGNVTISKKYVYTFKIIPQIDNVTLGTVALSRDLKLQAMQKKELGGWDFSVLLTPAPMPGSYQQEIVIPILTPANWPPIKILLSGQISGSDKKEQSIVPIGKNR